MSYAKKIADGLQGAYEKRCARGDLDVATDKWVIFSDHHKGGRDGADDYAQCEKAYTAALKYYFERGFTLVILGDGEELWECPPRKVLAAHRATLDLEAAFFKADQKRYLKFFGNHDSDWKRGGAVKRYLQPIFGEGLEVFEAMRVRVHVAGFELGELFLVHGHQGTIDADHYSWISRIAVRYGWAVLQRITKKKSTTPSKDYQLRHRHNVAMYEWVKDKRGTVLIAGHTHRPVFCQKPEFHNPSEMPPVEQVRPCYYNTGCCSYSDGDVTALEIAGGRMSLVRWPDDNDQPLPQLLASADMREVFGRSEVVTPAFPVPGIQ